MLLVSLPVNLFQSVILTFSLFIQTLLIIGIFLLDFSRIKTKGEKRGLDSAQLSIEQVPVCTSILVSCISDNTTHDAIELHFESRRNSGGPVERVQFVPKSGRAVVVFQDPKGS